MPLSNLPAQGNAMLKGLEGKKVRLSVPIFDTVANAGSVEIRGTVFEVCGDSIFVLQHGGQVSRIPLSGIRNLSASFGRDHWQGAQKGALAGVVGGHHPAAGNSRTGARRWYQAGSVVLS